MMGCMATKCDITGKGKMFGNNVVPDSQHKTRRAFKPNLQKKTFILNGKKVTLNISAAGIRTLKKKGVL